MSFSDEHKKIFELSELISGFLAGTLSEEQHVQLEAWLAEKEEHRALFDRICSEQTLREKMNRYRSEEVQFAFQDFVRRRQRLTFRRRMMQWAACAVLLLSLGGVWWQWRSVEPEMPGEVLAQKEVATDTAGRRPVLILASGEQILMPEAGMEAEDSELEQRFGIEKPALESQEEVYHTVEVPSMCDFHFTLSDGTKVWMNAVSSLRYPVTFAADSRTIYVSGEVYLEVAKDARRPFSVVVDGMRVEVLGTCFNVHAYPHEQETKITLAEGKVAAHIGTESYALVPGKQLSLEKASGGIAIRSVDVDDVLAWKRGVYVFKKCNLAEVVSTLQCWYDVEIVL
ncbi:MAG: FecR domain-containing protein, partial [Odoribacter sp.]|nr:FecR domain-containing protein [Odoribacter sp.]